MTNSDDGRVDAARGALLGALIGDAAGARLEFLGHRPSAADVEEAMRLPGGGCFRLAPGQVTDDGELTLSLADALVAAEGFELEAIARAYAAWVRSSPFDIGTTTRASLGAGAGQEDGRPGLAAVMAESAARHCQDSQANGALMRIVPLGIFGHALPPPILGRLAMLDDILSHPHPSCRAASAAYAIAIASLVRRPGERSAAIDAASTWLDQHGGPDAETATWLRAALAGEAIDATHQIGFVRIAFTLAFRALANGSSYADALRLTLAQGGDTDTNACIVGGLVGAATGAAGISEELKSKLAACDFQRGKQPRPAQFLPGRALELAPRLFALGSAPRISSTAPADGLVADLFARGQLRLATIDGPDTSFPTEPPQWDRVEGMLLGLAIGDALGNTSESMTAEARRERFGWITDYQPNRHAGNRKVGLPSDDTQLAFWTLEQLLADGCLIPSRLAERFCRQPIFGIGDTVRNFIRAFRKKGLPWHAAGQPSAGNGALMRIAPVILPHLAGPGCSLFNDTILAAMLTHNDPTSTAACLGFVHLLRELLVAEQPPDPSWYATRFAAVAGPLEGDTGLKCRVPGSPYVGPLSAFVEEQVPRALGSGESVVEAGQRWYSGAFLLETVPAALHILGLYGHDPEAAILHAVNETWDNDTVAAIVGAAVGALHGRAGLPGRWLDGLLGRTGADDDGRVFELLAAARRAWA